MLYRYRKGGRNHEGNCCILRIRPPAFYTEAKVAKGGNILAGHYSTTFYTEAKVAKGGAYLQDTTVQHFILRLRLQKGGHTCRTLQYNILY